MSAGYKTKAAFRLNKADLNVDLVPATNGAVVTAFPVSVATAAAGAQRMGPYDQIPFLSEGVKEAFSFEDDRTLLGKAGLPGSHVVSKLGSGPIELAAHYLGFDDIWAALLGFEKPSFDGSPSFDESESADNPMTGTTSAGTTGTTLEDTNVSQFISDNVGEFVRIADEGDGAEGQVRRITALTDTDNLVISPAWSTNPGAGKTYQIARAFTHNFECVPNLGVENIGDVYSTYAAETSGNATDKLLRFGTLVFDKSTSIWEWRGVMVNSLTLTHNAKTGAKISIECIPFDLDLSSSVNTASSTWGFSAGPTAPIHLQEKIVGADLVFRLGDWSSGTPLDSDDNQAISDFSITISNNLDAETQTTVSGLYRAEPKRGGFRTIMGSFTVPRYTSDTFPGKIASDTIQMASLVWTGSTLTGDNISSANALKLWIRAMKLTVHDAPVQSAGIISQAYTFKALIPTAASSGMPAVSNANTEIVVQTINNNPFNALRAQNGE